VPARIPQILDCFKSGTNPATAARNSRRIILCDPTVYRIEIYSAALRIVCAACAGAAVAEFPVTGNKRHFLQAGKATQAVSGREFLGLVGSSFQG